MLSGFYRSLPGTSLKAICPVTLAGHINFIKLCLIAWKLLYLASHKWKTNCCCSVAQSCLILAISRTAAHQTPLPCTGSQSYSGRHSLSQWRYWTMSSFATCFSCPQSLLASGSFPMSRPLTSDGQSIEASAWTTDLAINSPGWFPLGLTSWISLQSKGLYRIFLGTQSSLWSNFYIHTWLLEKP